MRFAGRIEWREIVDSTQDCLAAAIRTGQAVGAVAAETQTRGRGRFQRPWHSPNGTCVAVSMVFEGSVDHPRPYLIGMSVALAAANAFDLQLQWPNDLVHGDKKAGGVLCEIIEDSVGERWPCVGLGLNLARAEWPADIAERAVSIEEAHGSAIKPAQAVELISIELESIPMPSSWGDIRTAWMLRDSTPGKRFRTYQGLEGDAEGIGDDGSLLLRTPIGVESIYAADAVFGTETSPRP